MINTLEFIVTKKCSNPNCVHPLVKFGNNYPITDFGNHKRSQDGLYCYCRYCSNQKGRDNNNTFWRKCYACAWKANKRVENSIATTEDLFLLFIAQDGKCVYRDCVLTPRTMSLDHLKQVSKGGDNRIENLVWSYEPANLARNGHYSHKDLFFLMGKTEDQIAAIWSRIAYVHQTFLELKAMISLTPEFNLQQYALSYN